MGWVGLRSELSITQGTGSINRRSPCYQFYSMAAEKIEHIVIGESRKLALRAVLSGFIIGVLVFVSVSINSSLVAYLSLPPGRDFLYLSLLTVSVIGSLLRIGIAPLILLEFFSLYALSVHMWGIGFAAPVPSPLHRYFIIPALNAVIYASIFAAVGWLLGLGIRRVQL